MLEVIFPLIITSLFGICNWFFENWDQISFPRRTCNWLIRVKNDAFYTFGLKLNYSNLSVAIMSDQLTSIFLDEWQ